MPRLKNRTIVDRYRIDGYVDTGSSADVYKVTHVWLFQPMILKHLRNDVDPNMRNVLLDEGRLQCELHHQNLVTVHDAVEIDGRPALVMEFVDGPDLADWIDAREVPPLEEALPLFRGILSGVQAAHRLPVVHRDLKPENVLLATQGDGSFVPKVADFGLAKRMRQSGGRHSLSGSYALIGTPEYMAPEQIRDPGYVDVRADIFSLGAILYELCTGQVAFEAEDLREVLDRVLVGDFPPPQSHRPDLPAPLVALIVDMMELNPSDRPASTADVIARLDELALS